MKFRIFLGWTLIAAACILFFARVQIVQADVPQACTPPNCTLYLPLVQNGNAAPPPPPGGEIIINHTSVALFDRIPARYITAASQLHVLFRHASVGDNISDGLDCLMNNFTDRPAYCDSGLSPGQIIYDSKYNRSNWDFEFHSQPNPNNGWWNKVNYFIDRVNGLPGNSPYQYVGFKFGYVDGITGANIDEKFFNNDPNDSLPSIDDLTALQAQYPNRKIVYWTMGLARSVGTADSQNFNTQMRSYAQQHDLILMDIAAIQSHLPNGTACTDNLGQGLPALCDEYTDETNGGHLNAYGKLQMAKAFWVMMARLAGWDGVSP